MTAEQLPSERKPGDPPGPVDLTGTATGQSHTAGPAFQEHGTPIGFDPRQVNRCRSCNQLIWWRINPSGARQPFDYDAGNQLGTDMPHHATCPQGREWNRKRASKTPTPEDA